MVFVSFLSVFDYLEAVPSSRCVREGQEVLNANHLIMIGAKEKTLHKVVLFALCLKSSGLKDNPHEVQGTLEINDNEVTIQEFTCSCKAGQSSRCKHVAALLFFCTRSNIAELELLSTTDMGCYWKKEKDKALEMYEPMPISETPEVLNIKTFGNVAKRLKVAFTSDETQNIFVQQHQMQHLVNTGYSQSQHLFLFTNHCCRIGRRKAANLVIIQDVAVPDVIANLLIWANGSEILLSLPVIEPVSVCCSTTFSAIKSVNFLKVAFESAKNKTLWCAERQFRVTGSRCYNLYTYSRNNWEMKAMKYFWPKSWFLSNKYIQHGIASEGEARHAYCTTTQSEILETGLIISERHPWMAFSPDGIVMANGHPVKLLEIKCPFLGKTKSIEEVVLECKYVEIDEEGIPKLKKRHQYYGQIQFGMAILNLSECDFVIYSTFSKSYIVINIKLDIGYCIELIKKLQNIYFNNMLHEICKNKK